MPEITEALQAVVRLFIVVAFATLYMLGGRRASWPHMKVLRRYLGGVTLSGGTIAMAAWTGSFAWYMVVAVPAFIAALTMGYGGDEIQAKLKRRLLYGLALGASGIPLALGGSTLGLFWFQLVVAVLASVWLGVLNPARNAVDEETLVATCSTLCVPFYV